MNFSALYNLQKAPLSQIWPHVANNFINHHTMPKSEPRESRSYSVYARQSVYGFPVTSAHIIPNQISQLALTGGEERTTPWRPGNRRKHTHTSASNVDTWTQPHLHAHTLTLDDTRSFSTVNTHCIDLLTSKSKHICAQSISDECNRQK